MNNKQVSVPFANCLSLTCKCFFPLSLALFVIDLCVFRSYFIFGLDFSILFALFLQLLVSLIHLFACCFCVERRFSGTGGRERARDHSLVPRTDECENWWNKENTCLLRATYQPFQITWINLYAEIIFCFHST